MLLYLGEGAGPWWTTYVDPALLYWLLGAGKSTIEEAHVDVERREEGLRVQKKQNICRLNSHLGKESEWTPEITTHRLLGKDTGDTIRKLTSFPEIAPQEV